jgi:hypothetical protein
MGIGRCTVVAMRTSYKVSVSVMVKGGNDDLLRARHGQAGAGDRCRVLGGERGDVGEDGRHRRLRRVQVGSVTNAGEKTI